MNQAIFDKLKGIIAENLRVEKSKIRLKSNLTNDLGTDSLGKVEMILAVEDKFGIPVPDGDAEKIKTVEDLVKHIENQQ